MEIVEKKIKLTGIDLLAFLGFNDANLNVLESRFDATIAVRGDAVVVRGEPAEAGIIEKVINEMTYMVQRNGSLMPNDVSMIIDLVTGGRAEQQLQGQNLDEIILVGKEAVVKARNERQKEYYRKVRENDIVFS
ncbi:MAG: PhoH family protein, partial [bacterium]|nr:PhoH family protein [Candidatus Kapabacteria bacterium]